MEISQMLKEKRKEYQLNQEQLAEKVFVSKKTISNWETGKTTPDIDSLIRLAKLFDLSLDNLLLEGSMVVEEIKKREKAFEIQKVSLLGAQLTNLLLIAFLFLPELLSQFYISEPMYIVLLGVILSNTYTLYYFRRQLKEYKGTELESSKVKMGNRLYIVIAALFFILALAVKYLF
ncbi:hypothetical protein BAU15_13450 [Enterococcus sp. JM4C]|uniref:helix-turn-helix domain-containing protein n=1 Tax=Candidatus Enterococcus huntleyi TaxID=1857217 RepID=UPI00137B1F6A|nr:helix-turn-helix transcriptional regulator [Enterococcus sp. JM4C]KAF1296691.1 hypothetical protein BAU15_13450 [Enterococcus sp. JM4C]